MQRPSVDTTPNPYVSLALAILYRAVRDAQGHCDSPGKTAPEKIQGEALRWLAQETTVRDLVELAGYDADMILTRLRPLLEPPGR
jgi:hypothetical protein